MGQKETFGRVLHYIRKYWLYLAVSIVMASVTVALTLYFPILTGKVIDLVISPGRVDFPGVFVLLRQMIVVAVLTGAAQWVMNVCNNKMTYRIVEDIRNEAFRRIEILPLKYIDGHSYGEVVSRVIADVDQFADGLLMGFTQFFTGVITILGTLGFMLSINVAVTGVVVLVTPLSFFVAGFIARKTLPCFIYSRRPEANRPL